MGSTTSRWHGWKNRITAGIAATALTVPLLTAVTVQASEEGTQQEYLLSVSGDLSTVAAAVEASGGEVLESFAVAEALRVRMPESAAVPADATVVPDVSFSFNSRDDDKERGKSAQHRNSTNQNEEATTTDDTNTHRATTQVPDGVDGSGVTVALVDTGVADTGELNVEHINASDGAQGDGYGHGTHLAGLVAGSGAASGGELAGAAPGAKVLDVQVADEQGSTSMTEVLRGLQAVSDRAASDPSLKVVNLALSTGSPLPPWVDPLSRSLAQLWSDGLTVVVAAGNDGKDGVSSPATDPLLLAVGSVDENDTADRGDDVLADFSAYGKSFGVLRPDVSAPGVSLVSLRAPGSIADVENPDARVGDKYFKGTGTSMSAALVSGLVADLLSQRPDLSPTDVKRVLRASAFGKGLSLGAGTGGVDLTAALNTDVSATAALPDLDLGTDRGPLESDAAAWAAFAAAWEAGNLRGVVEAWIQLSPQGRRWAADAWSMAVLQHSLTMEDAEFFGRRWAGRRWATQNWEGRRWAEDAWVGRRWATIDWDGRRWAEDAWDGRRWAGRRWAADDWLAFAWTVSLAADSPEIQDQWKSEDWDGRRWAGRRWANTEWVGRRWASDAWEGRRWAGISWDGRRWAAGDWEGRRWSDMAWDGRRWATENWSGRRWSVTGWGM